MIEPLATVRTIIKQRISRQNMKRNSLRLCLHDPEIPQAGLKEHTPLKVVVDLKDRSMVMLPTVGKGDISVTYSNTKGKLVVDLKNQQLLQVFAGCDYLQITLYADGRIEVAGYMKAESEDLDHANGVGGIVKAVSDTVKSAAQFLAEKMGVQTKRRGAKVTDITHILKVKQVIAASMTVGELQQAVGETRATRHLQVVENATRQAVTSGWGGDFAGTLQPTFGYEPTPAEDLRQKLSQIMQAVSLFSGAGFFDWGFIYNNFRIVAALERDPDAVTTYRANFGDHIIKADITNFDLSKLPKVPVIFGGPPCIGFSSLNNRRGADNPYNSLVDFYIEAVQRNENCLAFAIENVDDFLTMEDPTGERFFDRVNQRLGDQFEISSGVLRATAYGGYQDRKRAIVLGGRKGSVGKIELPQALYTPQQYRTVGMAFEGLHDGIPNARDISQNEPLTVQRLDRIGQGENWRVLPDELKAGLNDKTYFHKYYRLKADEPSPTIMNLNKSHMAPPDGNHFLSVRQGARLQSVPDQHVFHGGLKARQTQVGNGVVVHMAYWVARVIREALERFVLQTEMGFAL